MSWHHPGKIPPHKERKILHKLLVKHLGYFPGVCGWDLRKMLSEGQLYQHTHVQLRHIKIGKIKPMGKNTHAPSTRTHTHTQKKNINMSHHTRTSSEDILRKRTFPKKTGWPLDIGKFREVSSPSSPCMVRMNPSSLLLGCRKLGSVGYNPNIPRL